MRSKLDIKTAEHEEVRSYGLFCHCSGLMECRKAYLLGRQLRTKPGEVEYVR